MVPTVRGIAWRLRYPIMAIVAVFMFGVVGFLVIGADPIDSVTDTILILTTIGFGAREPLTFTEKVLTNIVAVLGVSTYLALLAALAGTIAEGKVLEASRVRRAERGIRMLRGHVIVCAYGRVGRAVAEQLRTEGAPFAVVERDAGLVDQMRADGVLSLIADPSSEDVLRRMGVERASALITAVDSDADNVFIALTARSLNRDLFIVARASERNTADRLYKAGADRVVSPYVSSGMQMATLATRPRVVDYIELAAPDHRAPLRLEEILVEDGSPLIGQTIAGACGRATPVMLRRVDGQIVAPPEGTEALGAGDLVVVLGASEELAEAEGESA